MKKLLVFSHSAGGHHPEYLHHLYHGVVKEGKIEAIFVVPRCFQEKKGLFPWEACDRISFDYVPDEALSWGDGKWYKRNYRFAMVMQKYVKIHHPDEVFMLDPMICMPYLAFMVHRGTKVSGILYEIYQYRWHSLSYFRKIAALLWHWLLGRRKCFKNIFLLNDAETAQRDNQIYHTEHFRYLPDPYIPLPKPKEDFRQKYAISPTRKTFLHFGSMGRKKGTLEILESISCLSRDEQEKYCFVFAGCIQPVIHDEFYQRINDLKFSSSIQIFVFDQFCSYEFLAGWCAACDAILVPYLEAYNSSGCIGYAAQFNKPVIGPEYGLLGKLIKEYQFGVQVPEVDTPHLLDAYKEVHRYAINGVKYLQENSVENFCSAIFSDVTEKR